MDSDRHGVAHPLGAAVARPVGVRSRGARRPWWKWLAIGLLLAATITVTVVYATTLATDITRQHWANALDASREAVLVVVGWAAVTIVLSAEGDRTGGTQRGEGTGTSQDEDQPAAAAEPVRQAQDRVRRLRVRLAELSAVRERAGSGADPDLDRELSTTLARLEQARQWLTSAQSTRAAQRPAQASAARSASTPPITSSSSRSD